MCSNVTIIRERQLAIRRELDRRGVSLKAVSFDSGIPYPTLNSYFPADGSREPAQVSGSAIFSLCGVLPDDLASLLLPDSFQIVRAPDGIDHDELATLAHDYLQEKTAAHHPDSEAGPAIGPNEAERLNAKATLLQVAS